MGHPTRLPWSQRLCFGVGHCLNDLVASMWFSYLIVYLQLILGFDPTYAGFILLVGQVADAIATPLVGYEISSAEEGKWCRAYGKRKSLHLIGTLLVIASFPFIFSVCPGCENASELAYTVMLVPLVIIFQVGWAAVQVSHLSLIPVITPHEAERDFLNIFRYAVDIASDISTYIIVWCVFDLTRKPEGDHYTITSAYASKFMLITIIIMGIGSVFTVIFHIGVKENPSDPSSEHSSEPSSDEKGAIETIKQEKNSSLLSMTVSWVGWLKEVNFYQVGLMYTLARLFQNLTCVFIPLYLSESLRADDDFIAKIPLIMNVSGFLISMGLPKFFKVFGKKVCFFGGGALGLGSCIWVFLGDGPGFCKSGIYGVGVVMGAASSILVISALSFTHDLIGTSVESGAFVYGCMSFCDKLANGIVGMIIQRLHSLRCMQCDWFYRDVIAYVVGGVAVLCMLLIAILPSKLGQRKNGNGSNGSALYRKDEIPNYRSIEDTSETSRLTDREIG